MFKKAKVVMLPTNQKAGLVINPSTKKIQYIDFERSSKYYTDVAFVCNHLYILSDDEIKEGDWVIKNGHTTVYRIEKDSRIDNCKKILASTDKSLSLVCTCGATKVVNTGLCSECHLFTNIPLLPQPSQAFIEKYITEYNKGNIITDVMVEYDEWYEEDTSRNYIPGKGQPAIKFTQLKVDKNNKITITRIKDSWSRDEVIYLCGKAFFQGKNNYLQNEKAKNFDKWIEENL
jgi:hypothetical protein